MSELGKRSFRQMFEDTKGELSWMRVASTVALFNAILIQWFGLTSRLDWQQTTANVLPWLIAAFVPKALQRFAEKGPQPGGSNGG